MTYKKAASRADNKNTKESETTSYLFIYEFIQFMRKKIIILFLLMNVSYLMMHITNMDE